MNAIVFVLVAAFPQPHGEVLIAAYDTKGDCVEIAAMMNDNSETAEFYCVESSDAE